MGPSVQLDLTKWAIDMKNDGESVPVHTVDINKSKSSRRLYSKAVNEPKLQDIIDQTSTPDFIKYVGGNMIHNCPINREDILRAEDIFAPTVGCT